MVAKPFLLSSFGIGRTKSCPIKRNADERTNTMPVLNRIASFHDEMVA